MRKGFFISKEICVTFHRDAKALRQNIVSSGWRFLCSFDVELVRFIANGLAEVRISLKPHVWVADFADVVELVIPNRDVRVDVFAFENIHQLHLNGIARTIADRTFRTDGHDQVIILLGSALLDGTNDILANIAGKPFVDRGNLGTQTLKLVDAHGPDLKQRAGKKVFNTFLCRRELYAICFATSGVLQRAVCQEFKQGAARSCDRGSNWRHDLVRLPHGGGSGNLMGRRCVYIQEI